MQKEKFTNQLGNDVYYLSWTVDSPRCNVVIAHGMAEHPERYSDLANYLNKQSINVFAIFHIGHGDVANKLGHMGKGEFIQCVTNMNELITKVENETKLPTFLLGHSMGSFLSQLYLTKYSNIKGLILSGSTAATPIMKIGSVIASIVSDLAIDNSKPSPFMDKMSFGSYNAAIPNPRTNFDWLNRDEKEVDKYIADPLCGFVCSKSFFKGMCGGLKEMGSKKALTNVNIDIPILIHGGSKDPVSNSGKGLYDLQKQYINLGCKDVTFFIYDEARHEIYNELNKKEVYKNTLDFINNHL